MTAKVLKPKRRLGEACGGVDLVGICRAALRLPLRAVSKGRTVGLPRPRTCGADPRVGPTKIGPAWRDCRPMRTPASERRNRGSTCSPSRAKSKRACRRADSPRPLLARRARASLRSDYGYLWNLKTEMRGKSQRGAVPCRESDPGGALRGFRRSRRLVLPPAWPRPLIGVSVPLLIT